MGSNLLFEDVGEGPVAQQRHDAVDKEHRLRREGRLRCAVVVALHARLPRHVCATPQQRRVIFADGYTQARPQTRLARLI